MSTIQQTYEMNASPEEVFDALVNPEIIQLWSGDEAKMSADVGANFHLWSGQMFGINIEVTKNKKLVQQWNYTEWTAPSKVTIILKPKGKKTLVELLHEDVPEKALKSIEQGWNDYYLGAIQEMFEERKQLK
jgi:activator of HSP90 ATPase